MKSDSLKLFIDYFNFFSVSDSLSLTKTNSVTPFTANLENITMQKSLNPTNNSLISKRTKFSCVQVKELKHKFVQQRYITRKERTDLARNLGLTENQVYNWFKNRRSRSR